MKSPKLKPSKTEPFSNWSLQNFIFPKIEGQIIENLRSSKLKSWQAKLEVFKVVVSKIEVPKTKALKVETSKPSQTLLPLRVTLKAGYRILPQPGGIKLRTELGQM